MLAMGYAGNGLWQWAMLGLGYIMAMGYGYGLWQWAMLAMGYILAMGYGNGRANRLKVRLDSVECPSGLLLSIRFEICNLHPQSLQQGR